MIFCDWLIGAVKAHIGAHNVLIESSPSKAQHHWTPQAAKQSRRVWWSFCPQFLQFCHQKTVRKCAKSLLDSAGNCWAARAAVFWPWVTDLPIEPDIKKFKLVWLCGSLMIFAGTTSKDPHIAFHPRYPIHEEQWSDGSLQGPQDPSCPSPEAAWVGAGETAEWSAFLWCQCCQRLMSSVWHGIGWCRSLVCGTICWPYSLTWLCFCLASVVQGLLSQVQAVPMSLPKAISQSGSWSKVHSEWYDGTCIILCLPFFVLWVNSRFLMVFEFSGYLFVTHRQRHAVWCLIRFESLHLHSSVVCWPCPCFLFLQKSLRKRKGTVGRYRYAMVRRFLGKALPSWCTSR